MKKGKSKRKNSDSSEEIQEENIEKIYQKKSQLEHILVRPDSYIGSIEKIEDKLWVLDEQAEKLVLKTIYFVPGLFKIFDEILVNASDNIQRNIYFLIIILLNLYFLLFH